MGAKLYFKNPIFKLGTNISVRRGVKWDIADKKDVVLYDVDTGPIITKDIETFVICMYYVGQDVLENEHDPSCRHYIGLVEVMEQTYPKFNEMEIVTIVSWEITEQDVNNYNLKIG